FRSPGFQELKIARASESAQRHFSESGQAPPSPHRREPQYPAKFETCARPTRLCSFLAGNNDRSLWQHKSGVLEGKALLLITPNPVDGASSSVRCPQRTALDPTKVVNSAETADSPDLVEKRVGP